MKKITKRKRKSSEPTVAVPAAKTSEASVSPLESMKDSEIPELPPVENHLLTANLLVDKKNPPAKEEASMKKITKRKRKSSEPTVAVPAAKTSEASVSPLESMKDSEIPGLHPVENHGLPADLLVDKKNPPAKEEASIKKITKRKRKSTVQTIAKPSKASVSPLDSIKDSEIPYLAPIENHWLTADLFSLSLKQIYTGVRALDQGADAAQKQKVDADEMMFRNHTIKFLDHAATLVTVQPTWALKLYGKQLRHLSLVCDRAGDQLNTMDDDAAAHYWSAVGQSIEKLYAMDANQPEWIDLLFIGSSRKCAAALNRAAEKVKAEDDKKLADYRVMGARCIERLYARHSEQPEWVGGLFRKCLLEGAAACGRMANHAKESNEVKESIDYWFMASDCISKLYSLNPEQPESVAMLFAKSLRQCVVACAQMATNAKTNNEYKEAIHYVLLATATVEKLRARNEDQPEWVENCYRKSLLEGSAACIRVISLEKAGDSKTLELYQRQGVEFVRKLQSILPELPEWLKRAYPALIQ